MLFAAAAESTRPAALSVRAAAVSTALSAFLHAPSALTHSSANESWVNRSAWPVMFRLRCMGGLPGSRGHADEPQRRPRRSTKWQATDQTPHFGASVGERIGRGCFVR